MRTWRGHGVGVDRSHEPEPAADNVSPADEIAAAEEAEDQAQSGGLSTKKMKGD